MQVHGHLCNQYLKHHFVMYAIGEPIKKIKKFNTLLSNFDIW